MHDRLVYLAGEVALDNPPLPADAGREFSRLLRAAGTAVQVGVTYLDREIFEQPTLLCPVCRMIARLERDGGGSPWRVCDYCGASEPVRVQTTTAGIVTRANLDGLRSDAPCAGCGRKTVTVDAATGYCADCDSLRVG